MSGVRSWCYLVVLAVLLLTNCGGTSTDDWNVLFVTFDTTRADALGCYGNERSETPTLDALAEGGFLFEHAYTAVPITLPSHSTMFTGTYPPAHGVRDNGMFKLAQSRTTLAEVLRDHGFKTGAAIGAFPLTREFGIDQGFDFFDDDITRRRENLQGLETAARAGLFFDERPSPEVNDAIVPWIREQAGERFFAWIHYWDPHQPLHPAAPYNQLFAHDLYLGEVSQADHSLGKLLEELERLGVRDKTIIVMTADHGEGHGEHNEDTHSMLLYNSTLHVPAIFSVPGRNGGLRLHQRVGTVDLMPTLLELLKIDVPSNLHGRSLVPLIEGREDWPDRPLYAETLSPRLSHGWGELRSLTYEDRKYSHGPQRELFDLASDPREIRNLATSEPQNAKRYQLLLQEFLARHRSEDAADSVQEVDASTRERLAAMGYLSGGGDSPSSIVEELRDDGTAPQERVGDISLSSRAKQAIDNQRFLEAKEIGAELLRRDPENGYYLGLLGHAYLGLGQLEEAAKLAEAADEVVSQNDAVFLHVARLLFQRGARTRGLRLATRLVDEHATAYGHYLLGEMGYALGNDTVRVSQLEQALALEPGFDLALMSLAVHSEEQGDGALAELRLRELLGFHPLHTQAQFNLAVILMRKGDYSEAQRFLDRVLRLDPGYCKARVALVALHQDSERRELAEAAYSGVQQWCSDPQTLEHAASLMEMQ